MGKKKNYVQTEGRGILAGGKHEKMLTQKQWQKKNKQPNNPQQSSPNCVQPQLSTRARKEAPMLSELSAPCSTINCGVRLPELTRSEEHRAGAAHTARLIVPGVSLAHNSHFTIPTGTHLATFIPHILRTSEVQNGDPRCRFPLCAKD